MSSVIYNFSDLQFHRGTRIFLSSTKILISMGLLGLSALTYTLSLWWSLSNYASLEMYNWIASSQNRAKMFISRSLISASSLFNDRPSSPTPLPHEALAVISDAGGPTRLWGGIPAFRSVLGFVSWEKSPDWSPAGACQGKGQSCWGLWCLWVPGCASKATASTLWEATQAGRRQLSRLYSLLPGHLGILSCLGSDSCHCMCPWGIYVLEGRVE